jgi:hypothetical protein
MKQIDEVFKSQIEAYINDNWLETESSLYVWDKIVKEWDLSEYNTDEVILCYFDFLAKKYN